MISSLHIFREGNSRQGVDDLLSISVKFAMKLGVKRCIDVERMFLLEVFAALKTAFSDARGDSMSTETPVIKEPSIPARRIRS